jgi:hypothetical protein
MKRLMLPILLALLTGCISLSRSRYEDYIVIPSTESKIAWSRADYKLISLGYTFRPVSYASSYVSRYEYEVSINSVSPFANEYVLEPSNELVIVREELPQGTKIVCFHWREKIEPETETEKETNRKIVENIDYYLSHGDDGNTKYRGRQYTWINGVPINKIPIDELAKIRKKLTTKVEIKDPFIEDILYYIKTGKVGDKAPALDGK